MSNEMFKKENLDSTFADLLKRRQSLEDLLKRHQTLEDVLNWISSVEAVSPISDPLSPINDLANELALIDAVFAAYRKIHSCGALTKAPFENAKARGGVANFGGDTPTYTVGVNIDRSFRRVDDLDEAKKYLIADVAEHVESLEMPTPPGIRIKVGSVVFWLEKDMPTKPLFAPQPPKS